MSTKFVSEFAWCGCPFTDPSMAGSEQANHKNTTVTIPAEPALEGAAVEALYNLVSSCLGWLAPLVSKSRFLSFWRYNMECWWINICSASSCKKIVTMLNEIIQSIPVAWESIFLLPQSVLQNFWHYYFVVTYHIKVEELKLERQFHDEMKVPPHFIFFEITGQPEK